MVILQRSHNAAIPAESYDLWETA